MEATKPHQIVEQTINAYDTAALANEYRKHNLLIIEDFLPREFVMTHYVPQIDNCSQFIHRVNIPGFKKSGSVSYSNLKQYATNLYDIYASLIFKQFIAAIVGEHMIKPCPESDQHAAALYFYTEPGDRIKKHYDKSFYRGKRFTVLLGMIQESTHSNLVCYPGAKKLTRKNNPLVVTTHPGTLVLFNGDTLWHEVTPLGENEKRVILTMEYLTDTKISLMNKWVSNFKDQLLYFGKNQNQQA